MLTPGKRETIAERRARLAETRGETNMLEPQPDTDIQAEQAAEAAADNEAAEEPKAKTAKKSSRRKR